MRCAIRVAILMSVICLVVPNVAEAQFNHSAWTWNPNASYWFRKCSFYGGGHQYVVYKPSYTRRWVFWYNPNTQVYWCACPTSYHPIYGIQVAQAGKFDLFILLIEKARVVENALFPQNIEDNIKTTMTAKDANGNDVSLNGLPSDLPSG